MCTSNPDVSVYICLKYQPTYLESIVLLFHLTLYVIPRFIHLYVCHFSPRWKPTTAYSFSNFELYRKDGSSCFIFSFDCLHVRNVSYKPSVSLYLLTKMWFDIFFLKYVRVKLIIRTEKNIVYIISYDLLIAINNNNVIKHKERE